MPAGTFYNFDRAAPEEPTVFGAARAGYPSLHPTDDAVADWLAFLDRRGIERVCCLLDDDQLDTYDDLLGTYADHFGPDRVCHAPIPDYERVDPAVLVETILPFLTTADRREEPVVVHCSAGLGRTGHVLALWLVCGRGYALDDAIATVTRRGRRPLEATSREALQDLVAACGGE
jgi:protein-tyrosine phosphatase